MNGGCKRLPYANMDYGDLTPKIGFILSVNFTSDSI